MSLLFTWLHRYTEIPKNNIFKLFKFDVLLIITQEGHLDVLKFLVESGGSLYVS